ncbi:MAG: sigma-70 family RNA polymerase sigma factor [Bacteroidota bacterium]
MSALDLTAVLQNPQLEAHSVMEQLWPHVNPELRRIAHHHLRRERADHTLNTTALVHEAYLRLVDHQAVDWKGRAHFYAVCAKAMRHILVDYARRKQAQKRGGQAVHLALDDVQVAAQERAADLLALDEALTQLAALDPRLAQVVEHRFFGGLEVRETAEVLGLSPRTVKRDWRKARLWLLRAMQEAG